MALEVSSVSGRPFCGGERFRLTGLHTHGVDANNRSTALSDGLIRISCTRDVPPMMLEAVAAANPELSNVRCKRAHSQVTSLLVVYLDIDGISHNSSTIAKSCKACTARRLPFRRCPRTFDDTVPCVPFQILRLFSFAADEIVNSLNQVALNGCVRHALTSLLCVVAHSRSVVCTRMARGCPRQHRDWTHHPASAPGLGSPCHSCTGTRLTLVAPLDV